MQTSQQVAARQSGQPLPGVGDVGQAGVGVLPEVAEFAIFSARLGSMRGCENWRLPESSPEQCKSCR